MRTQVVTNKINILPQNEPGVDKRNQNDISQIVTNYGAQVNLDKDSSSKASLEKRNADIGIENVDMTKINTTEETVN